MSEKLILRVISYMLLENAKIKKQRESIRCKCNFCGKEYSTLRRNLGSLEENDAHYCSQKCISHSFMGTKRFVEVACDQCGALFHQYDQNYKNHKNHFCSNSCCIKYLNIHKGGTNGKRSKIEAWIEKNLLISYPEIKFVFNSRTVIKELELDIFIPSLNLAFELNGVFHYQPIYPTQFIKTQQRDKNKMVECAALGIDLCVIDISSMKNFKPNSAQKYLDIIIEIINERIKSYADGKGLDP